MIILSFDVEDWFHILDNDSTRTEHEWNKFESRLNYGLDFIFNELEKRNLKATFFCLGWIAKKHPSIIKRINDAGYEVACHSFSHQLVYDLNPQKFLEDTKKAKELLEDLISKEVRIYRAPGFSIRESEKWAFEILFELGFEIDCSIFPSNRGHGGFSSFGYGKACKIKYNSSELIELPININKFITSDYVFSGGGYFRFFPMWLLLKLFKNSEYVMTYFHPRDFDAEQPIINELSFLRKFKSYYGLKNSRDKFTKLLDNFHFTDIDGYLKYLNTKTLPIVDLN
jgi:polysaccharide deacetylase family protein (PEP-CTERM system associated)